MTCENCGISFSPSRSWAKFCSDKCRTDFHNNKKAIEREEKRKSEIEPIKCPYCKTIQDEDSPRVFEVLEPSIYFCNVCAKSFQQQE